MANGLLDIEDGPFITFTAWLNAGSASFDGKALTYNAGGPNPGLSVAQDGNRVFHSQLNGRTLKYMILGSPKKYLVILDIETGSPSTRRLSLVNFSTWTEVLIFSVTASSAGTALPNVNPSQGNGTVFLGYGQRGGDHTNVAIYRSDNGTVLCSLGFIFTPTGQTSGEAAATELIIHYSRGGVRRSHACPKPQDNS